MLLAGGSAIAQQQGQDQQEAKQTSTWIVSLHADPERTLDVLADNGVRVKRGYNPIALSWLDVASPVTGADLQSHTLANRKLVRGHILKLDDATSGEDRPTIPGLGFYEGVSQARPYEEAGHDFSAVMADALDHLTVRTDGASSRGMGVQVLDVGGVGFAEAEFALWFNGHVTIIRNDIKRLLHGADRMQSPASSVSARANLIYGEPHQVLPVLSAGLYDLIWVGTGLRDLPSREVVTATLEQLGRVGKSKSMVAGSLSLPGQKAVDSLSKKTLEQVVSRYRTGIVTMKPPTSVQPFVISLGRRKMTAPRRY